MNIVKNLALLFFLLPTLLVAQNNVIDINAGNCTPTPDNIQLNADGSTLELVDGETGQITSVAMCAVVSLCETTSTLTNNGDGTYTYTNEDGTATNVVAGGINAYQNNTAGAIPGVLTDPTVIAAPNNGDQVIQSYNDGFVVSTYNGTTWDNVRTPAGAGETTTTLVDNGNGSFTYTNEAGTPVIYTEVVTTLAYNPATNTVTYINESGVTTNMVLSGSGTNDFQDNTANPLPAVPVDPTVIAVPYEGDQVVQAYNDGFVVSTYNGTTWDNVATPSGVVTTLVDNGNASFTYTSENGTVTNYSEAVTTLAYAPATNTVSYTNEQGVTTNMILAGSGTNVTQDNTGANIPAVPVDPTAIAVPYEGDQVVQEYDNGIVISTYNGTTWTNNAVPTSGTISVMTQTVLAGNQIASHNDGNGTIVPLFETVTTFVNNNDGTWTLTPEDATAIVFSDAGSHIQNNTGGNIPAVLVDPTVVAAPVEGDEVTQQYDDGVVLSTFTGGAWNNTSVLAGGTFIVNAGTTAAITDDALGTATVGPNTTLHFWSPDGSTQFAVAPGSAVVGINAPITATQSNAGNTVPAVLVDPTLATPQLGDAVLQTYDDGEVLSVYDGAAWTNTQIDAALPTRTLGSVYFQGPTGEIDWLEDNANFFFDDALDRLYLGNNSDDQVFPYGFVDPNELRIYRNDGASNGWSRTIQTALHNQLFRAIGDGEILADGTTPQRLFSTGQLDAGGNFVNTFPLPVGTNYGALTWDFWTGAGLVNLAAIEVRQEATQRAIHFSATSSPNPDFSILENRDLRFDFYPNTRSDIATVPQTNVLYTGPDGHLYSAPFTAATAATITTSAVAGETPVTNPPAAPVAGDEFINTADSDEWIYNGAAWVEVFPDLQRTEGSVYYQGLAGTGDIDWMEDNALFQYDDVNKKLLVGDHQGVETTNIFYPDGSTIDGSATAIVGGRALYTDYQSTFHGGRFITGVWGGALQIYTDKNDRQVAGGGFTSELFFRGRPQAGWALNDKVGHIGAVDDAAPVAQGGVAGGGIVFLVDNLAPFGTTFRYYARGDNTNSVMDLTSAGEMIIPYYPNTRNDIATVPQTNVLYTGPDGHVYSAPFTAAGAATITTSAVAGENPTANPPAAPVAGDEYINTVDGTEFVYDGAAWVAVSPHIGTQGSVFFAGADTYPTEDNANFFWDDAIDRLELRPNDYVDPFPGGGQFRIQDGMANNGAGIDGLIQDNIGGWTLMRVTDNVSNGTVVNMIRSRGTMAARTLPQAGDVIGNMNWLDGTQFAIHGTLGLESLGSFANGQLAGQMILSVRENNAIVERKIEVHPQSDATINANLSSVRLLDFPNTRDDVARGVAQTNVLYTDADGFVQSAPFTNPATLQRTEGSVYFQDVTGTGDITWTEDNANFYWHDDVDRLTIGTNVPLNAFTFAPDDGFSRFQVEGGNGMAVITDQAVMSSHAWNNDPGQATQYFRMNEKPAGSTSFGSTSIDYYIGTDFELITGTDNAFREYRQGFYYGDTPNGGALDSRADLLAGGVDADKNLFSWMILDGGFNNYDRLFNIRLNGDLQANYYPNTRDDTATDPQTNVLYTTANGTIKSAPFTNPAALQRTEGSVYFQAPTGTGDITWTEDNANFFYDDANNQLRMFTGGDFAPNPVGLGDLTWQGVVLEETDATTANPVFSIIENTANNNQEARYTFDKFNGGVLNRFVTKKFTTSDTWSGVYNQQFMSETNLVNLQTGNTNVAAFQFGATVMELDGAENFVSLRNLAYVQANLPDLNMFSVNYGNATAGFNDPLFIVGVSESRFNTDVTIDGKLNVTGLIDPTGLQLDPQAVNPMIAVNPALAAQTLWIDSGTGELMIGSTQVTNQATAGGASVITDAISTNQTGYSPTGFVGADVIEITPTGTVEIQGIAPAAHGETKVFVNAGTGTLLLMDEHASAVVDGEVKLPGGNVSIGPDGTFTGVYSTNANAWRVVSIVN